MLNIDWQLLEERYSMSQISPLFRVHKLNDAGLVKAEYIADAFNNLLAELTDILPDGREFSIVKTKLEEAAFFAKKAMANVAGNQE